MALYPKALHKLIPPGSGDPRIVPTQAVVHVDAGNATTLYGWFTNPKANGVESHFHVRRDGIVEQYRDTNYQADAQVGGGREAVSIETQGYGSGEWTPEQLEALVALLRWLLTVHPGILPRVCPSPYAAGIGYHSLFPSSMEGTWARDGRTCPGPDRIVQFRTTIVPALTGARPMEDTVTPEQMQELKDHMNALAVGGFTWKDGETFHGMARVDIETQRRVTKLRAEVATLTAAVETLAGVLTGTAPEALEEQLRDALGRIRVTMAEDEEVPA